MKADVGFGDDKIRRRISLGGFKTRPMKIFYYYPQKNVGRPRAFADIEHLKYTGEYPIIGVNTFRNPEGAETPMTLELARSTDEEKQSQLKRLQDFHIRHADEAPAMLKRLQTAVIENQNVFAVLMDAVRRCSLGQITDALFEVGGQYRRNM